MLRIGCVQYLNARPLIHDWGGPVVFDHPSRLCARLAGGDLDVALVSSFEFLRNPIYRIVNGVSISSHGPVYSVVLVHAGEVSEIEEVELDPASETSAALLRALFAERGLTPKFVATGELPITTRRARLLIGDQAIRFRDEHADHFHFWDLGEQWRGFAQLPFVYALWLIRPEVSGAEDIADRLRELCANNLANLDRLIADCADPDFCARYYREHLRFTFGESERQGLDAFARLCARHSLLQVPNPKFDLV